MTARPDPHAPRRRVDINMHDLDVGLWQEDAQDPSFRAQVFRGLIRHLRRRGWTIGPDEEVQKRYPSLARDHRRCRKGPFHATLEISGRCVRLEAWAETWRKDNPNGHRFDFDKRRRLSFLDALRFELEQRHILAWARRRFDIEVSDGGVSCGPHLGGLTAMEWIARDYARSSHVPVRPGWPAPGAYGNASAEGRTVAQGAEVWLRGRTGRWLRGRAYVNLGNLWWVVLNPYEVENRAAHELHLDRPADLRDKGDPRRRRARLEGEMTRAVRADDFHRAALLKRILFGDAPVYRIFDHGKNRLFYAPNFAGYTADTAAAGRYTRAEAEREVLRVPHLLTLVCPDGQRVRGDELRAEAGAREAVCGRS